MHFKNIDTDIPAKTRVNRKKTMLPPEYIAIPKHVNANNKSKTAIPCVGLAPIGSTSIENLNFGDDSASRRGRH